MQKLVQFVGASVAVISIAAAWTAAPAAPAVQPVASATTVYVAPAQNPWVTLSIMTGSSASSAAVNQGERHELASIGWPNALPLSAILSTIATDIFIFFEDHDSGPQPISPA